MIVKKITALFLLLALIGAIAPLGSTLAQEQREGLGISPTTLSLEANPGEKLEGEISVVNAGAKVQHYKVYVADLKIVNENYDKNFEITSDATSPVSWFTFPVTTGELAPEATQAVRYSVEVPQSALSRGYYATIFAETVADTPDASGVVRVKRVGSLVYIKVKGGLTEKGQVVSFTHSKWYRKKPIKAELRVQNQGNVHFAVKGEARLKNIFGRTISTAPIEGTILPETTRKFSVDLSISRAFGLYKIESTVDYLGKDTTVGPRWVLIASPLWLIIIAGVLLGWVVLKIVRVKHRAKRKK